MEAGQTIQTARQMGDSLGRGWDRPAVRRLGYVAIGLVTVAVLELVVLLSVLDNPPPVNLPLFKTENHCNKYGCTEYPPGWFESELSKAPSKPSQQPTTPGTIESIAQPANRNLIVTGLIFAILAFGTSGLGYYRLKGNERKQAQFNALSAEERDNLIKEQLEREQDREYFKLVRREVRQLRKDVPMFLSTMMKLDYDVSTYGKRRARPKKRKKDLIQFEWIGLTKTEVWFKVDTYRLPYGVSVLKLKDPDVTENLKHGINRPCLWHTDNSFNVFLRVGLRSGHLGVPTFVSWLPNEEKGLVGVEHKLPAVQPNKYLVPVGVDATNRLRYVDLVEWPHGLVLGATGRGKTSILLLWLAVLMKRHTPRQAKFVLIDLKKAAFPRFKRLPHVQEMTIDTERAVELLEQAVDLIDQRNTAYSEQAYNIDDWNRKFPHLYQHRLFVVVDELSLIMQSTDKQIANRAVTSILRIVQLGRSCGVHLILGTQTVNKHVLRHEITGNIEGRVCYHVKTKSSSILAIGSDDASDLYLPGRAILDMRGNNLVVQSPFATDMEIDRMLVEIAGTDYSQVTEDRFWEIALEEPLHVSGPGMYERLGESWGLVRCKTFLKNWEFTEGNNYPVIMVQGEPFILLSHGRGLGRALLPVVDGLLDMLKEPETDYSPDGVSCLDIGDQGVIEGQENLSDSPELSVSPDSPNRFTMTIEQIILNDHNGLARVDDLINSENGMSEYEIRKRLKHLEYKPAEQNVFEIDNQRFILTKALRGLAPRFLLPVNGHLPASNHELKMMAKEYWKNHYGNGNQEPSSEPEVIEAS